ncbi:hypothetical protein ACFQ0D_27530, partial [Micromonospora zhanjiangensis]
MSSYTITIAPDDSSQATTTLRVESTDTGTRITELLVRAGDGEGLGVNQLPAVDLNQLLRAVIPASPVQHELAGAPRSEDGQPIQATVDPVDGPARSVDAADAAIESVDAVDDERVAPRPTEALPVEAPAHAAAS